VTVTSLSLAGTIDSLARFVVFWGWTIWELTPNLQQIQNV
jgi:hypothetical protein